MYMLINLIHLTISSLLNLLTKHHIRTSTYLRGGKSRIFKFNFQLIKYYQEEAYIVYFLDIHFLSVNDECLKREWLMNCLNELKNLHVHRIMIFLLFLFFKKVNKITKKLQFSSF